VCGLYNVPEDEGEEKGAHLPEKVHGAGYRAGVIPENKKAGNYSGPFLNIL
jgi:hypothetical protein